MLKHQPVRYSTSRNGVATSLILIVVAGLALVGGAIYYLMNQEESGPTIDPILATVSRGEFISQVLDQGEIQSSDNAEIRCEVSSRNGNVSVIEVVPEGTKVKEGDFLVQLDSTAFENELERQKIAVATAETSVIQAEADLNVAIEAKKEYEQGTFEQTKLEIENEIADAKSAIETAKQEKEQSEAVLKHSIKLAQKGFITNQQREGDEFAVTRAEIALQRANNSLKLANTKLDVLQNITYNKEMFQYNSDIEAAKVRLNNQKESLDVESGQLAEIEDMIEKCRVVVPPGVSGQVVYAKESNRRGEDWVLEEGTTVRERQVLIRLPNPDKMEVKALINEQSITLIETGMPCTIRVDALTNVALKGVVTKVNQYAESSGWMSSSVRKYAVLVRIIDPPPTLKPGMNASVNIQTLYQEDAIMAPIQVVYAVGDRKFCLIKTNDDSKPWDTREIEVAADNSQMIWIKSGVEPGDELVMNPGAFKELMDLPEIKLDQKIEVPDEAVADAKKKGADGPGDGAKPGGPQPGGGGGGGPPIDMIVDRTMQKYDTNGDGKIDAEEQKSFDDRAKRVASDTNGDGDITREEVKKAMEAMMKRFSGGAGGGGGGRGGRGPR